jgi:hypothetical protein
MFIATINGTEVFSHKSESQVRAFSRDYLKSEVHLGEIIQISKDDIENSMVFSSKKRPSGKISMIDITNDYKTNQIVKDNSIQLIDNENVSNIEQVKSDDIDIPIQTNVIGNAKYPRWEVYWKDADGCRIPKSTIVGLEWFTMNYDDPKEKQWMDEHGYTPDILQNILAIPVNQEEIYDELSDEWGQVKKIKRLQ